MAVAKTPGRRRKGSAPGRAASPTLASVRAAPKTVEALTAIDARFALIGGQAVAARTEPRFTEDVDLAVAVADDVQAQQVRAKLALEPQFHEHPGSDPANEDAEPLQRYDASKPVDPAALRAAGSDELARLNCAYHAKKRLPVGGSESAHAMAHVMIEMGLAHDDPPELRKTQVRLMTQGLDRHESIHALSALMFSWLFQGGEPKAIDPERLGAELNKFSRTKWERDFGE